MKKTTSLLAMIVCMTVASIAQNSLQIHIKNIELIEGKIMLQLSTDSLIFKSDSAQDFYVSEETVVSSKTIVVFNDLPDGVYAFAVYQDLNENGKLDRKKFGIPAEPFAFSNDALGKFGPPKFSEASFELKSGGMHQEEVSMIYHKPKRKDQNAE